MQIQKKNYVHTVARISYNQHNSTQISLKADG